VIREEFEDFKTEVNDNFSEIATQLASMFERIDSYESMFLQPTRLKGVYKLYEEGFPNLAYIGRTGDLTAREKQHRMGDSASCHFSMWVRAHGGRLVFEVLDPDPCQERFHMIKFEEQGGTRVNREFREWTPPLWSKSLKTQEPAFIYTEHLVTGH
jgi:hypothetical protein